VTVKRDWLVAEPTPLLAARDLDASSLVWFRFNIMMDRSRPSAYYLAAASARFGPRAGGSATTRKLGDRPRRSDRVSHEKRRTAFYEEAR